MLSERSGISLKLLPIFLKDGIAQWQIQNVDFEVCYWKCTCSACWLLRGKWTIKYFYHKQIRKSEIIFLFFLAKDVVDNLLNSIHSYVGKNYAYTVIDLCRWFNAVRIGSNDAIKFLLVTSRLNMKYELLVTTVIVIRSFHENTWRIHHIISGLMHPEQFSNFEWCMQLLFI